MDEGKNGAGWIIVSIMMEVREDEEAYWVVVERGEGNADWSRSLGCEGVVYWTSGIGKLRYR